MEQYIAPLHINGLNGRIAHMPAPTQGAPEVLFIYGHHSSLERWWGILALLNQYCAVTMPDLPGFGGMDSLYKIGKPATLDNLADYVADVIRQRYQDRKVIIIGMSLGFVIVTRMLQRHPELTLNVEKLISLFGFAHTDDFVMPPKQRKFYLRGSRLFSLPLTHRLYRVALLNRFVLSRAYHKTPNAREKFKHATPEEHKRAMDFEIGLWQDNDLRTYMKTSAEFLTLDNTRVRINLPVYHVAVARDRYFDNSSVRKHFSKIFSSYHLLAELQNGSHAPTRVATAEEAKTLIPDELLKAVI
ncbi:MAG TPA: alpha/beta hydrolase [Candidatus Saccharimonadales bacterium]|nr:alpha/beta hydrolase [Candidatus Saccharimonadales bacterium]